MGRGSSWNAEELEDVAKAWITASSDPVVGIDQTATRFANTIYSSFIERAPDDPLTKERYRLRSAKSVKLRFDTIAADIQKFQKSLRLVHSCSPTGTTDQQVLSMAIAIHVGKINRMSYEFKDLDHDVWLYHLAYKALKNHPKFMFQSSATTSTAPSAQREQNENTRIGSIEPVTEEGGNGNEISAVIESASSSAVNSVVNSAANSDREEEKKTVHENPIGRKNAKRQMQADAMAKENMNNARSIARSLKLKADLEEEKNAMRMFSLSPCETEEDKREKDEFFRMMRRRYLRRARERELEEEEAVVGGNGGTDNSTNVNRNKEGE